MGEAVFINGGYFVYYPFFGVVMFKDDVQTDKHIVGHGYSDIRNLSIIPNLRDPKSVAFTKKCAEFDDIIAYTFSRKVGNVWIGTFKSIAIGRGMSKCVLTEVLDDKFFDPASML